MGHTVRVQDAFAYVLFGVVIVGVIVAVITFFMTGKAYDQIGKGGFYRDEAKAGGGSVNLAERDDEIRQMLEARNRRRVARGQDPLDVEAELAELDEDEAAVMREELGIAESGLDRIVRGAFGLLDLIAFFTAGEAKPAQSWHLRRGLTAWHAAGQIHSDIQKGFVRAEVIAWDKLVEAGGYAKARDAGTLRLEGRDYLMTDGDVITIKHTG